MNLDAIPNGSEVFLSFGEIDCRHDEGFISAIAKTGKPMRSLIEETTEGYVSWFLTNNQNNSHKLHFFNVPAPLYREELSKETNLTAAKIVETFNCCLKKNLYSNSAKMIDVYCLTRDEEGFSNKKYHCDDFHLDRRILSLIEKQLN